MSESGSTGRGSWIVYGLALLVVGGIWFTFRVGQDAGRSDLDRWAEERLDLDGIRAGLARDDVENVGHALMQLHVQSLAARTDEERALYRELIGVAGRHMTSGEVRIRRLLAYAAGHIDAPTSPDILRGLIGDGASEVRLVAAMVVAPAAVNSAPRVNQRLGFSTTRSSNGNWRPGSRPPTDCTSRFEPSRKRSARRATTTPSSSKSRPPASRRTPRPTARKRFRRAVRRVAVRATSRRTGSRRSRPIPTSSQLSKGRTRSFTSSSHRSEGSHCRRIEGGLLPCLPLAFSSPG